MKSMSNRSKTGVVSLRLIFALAVSAAAASLSYTQTEKKIFSIPEFKQAGTGPTTLLLIPCMSCRWNEWEEFIERNQTKYTMYAITVPGFGGTPVPDLPRGTDSTPWRDNLLNAISQFIDEHKLKDITVVGHSWGTMIGVQIANRRQDVVKRLIAVDGSIESTTWLPREREKRMAQARQVVESYSKKFESAEEWEKFNSVGIPPGDSVPRESVAQLIRTHGSFMATSKDALLEYWRENMLADITSSVKNLQIPILDIKCLRGTDQEGQRKRHLEGLRQVGVPTHTRTIFFYNTTHFVMFHRPQEFDQIITDFIAGKEVKDFVPAQ